MTQPRINSKTLRHEIIAICPKAVNDLLSLGIESAPLPTTIDKNIATIPIFGVLRQRGFPTDYGWIKGQCEAALNNKEIKQINLEIDSPGGEVLGVSELAEFLYISRTIKPIFAIVKNMACSAAYWLASACSKIILAGETTITGSIGVLAIHVDESMATQKEGIKITEIASGKYKNIASPNSPLSSDGQAYLKEQVDQLYSLFVQSIAKYRKMDLQKVIAIADGREYIGSRAIGLGLADAIQTTIQGTSIMNPEEMQKMIDQLKQENEQLRQELDQEKQKNKPSEPKQTAEEEEKKPVCENVPEEEKMKQAISVAVKKAQAEERERLIALDDLDYGSHAHEVVMNAKREGWTAEATALKILQSQSRVNKSLRDDLRAESKTVAVSTVSVTDQEKDQIAKAIVAGSQTYVRR